MSLLRLFFFSNRILANLGCEENPGSFNENFFLALKLFVKSFGWVLFRMLLIARKSVALRTHHSSHFTLTNTDVSNRRGDQIYLPTKDFGENPVGKPMIVHL